MNIIWILKCSPLPNKNVMSNDQVTGESIGEGNKSKQ